MIRLKEGANGVELHGMTEQAHWGMRQVDEVWKEFGYQECWVTSVTDGIHGRKSLHPHGRAWDVRPPLDPEENWSANIEILDRCIEVLYGFDCLLHGEPIHYHFEWDPRSPPR